MADKNLVTAGTLQALGTGVQIIAHNIANVSTPKFEPLRTDYLSNSGYGVHAAIIPERSAHTGLCDKESGTDLATEFVRLIEHEHAFKANAKVITGADEMMGTLLNLKG